MRISGLLTVLMCTTVALSACSSGDEGLVLGSRDDIIIMKNGVPVDGSATKVALQDAEPETSQDIMMEKETAEVVADAKTEMTTTSTDIAEEVVATKTEAETKVVETIVKTEKVTPEEIQARMAQVETAPQAQTKMADVKTPTVAEPVKEAAAIVSESQSVATDMDPVKEVVMTETKVKVKEEIKTSPVVETVEENVEQISHDVVASVEPVIQKTAAPQPVQTPETAAAPAPKMIEGCVKKILIPSTPGNISPTPVFEQRQVVCQKDITPGLVAIVQKALINKGYNIGSPDGRLGNKTFNAMEDYQRKNGLAVGAFTVETLESLNIKK